MKKLFYKSLLMSVFLGLVAYGYWRLPDVSHLKKTDPKTTALMELRDQECRDKGLQPRRRQIWVPYHAVSEHLKKAIIISEDASFFSHSGIDLFELKESIKEDWEEKSFKRGGSTITMQLARNLYLSPSKNPLRKVKEIIIALQLEQALSKERIFEIYLNVAEWGEGVYGAEAASLYYYSKPASGLDELEGATLAALLPSPRNPEERDLRYRRNLILQRMAKIGYIGGTEYVPGKRDSPLPQVKNQASCPKNVSVSFLITERLREYAARQSSFERQKTRQIKEFRELIPSFDRFLFVRRPERTLI